MGRPVRSPAFLLAAAVALGCGGPAPSAFGPPAARLAPSLQLPDWTDKYAATNQGDVRFFEIEALMAEHGLSRLAAVELQNHYRDLTRARPGDRQAAFREALSRARRGIFESGLSPARLAEAPFIVVFDLDETLYDQYGASESCHDLAFERPDGRTQYIMRAPGWARAIRRVGALGGLVVLFSANLDEVNARNLSHWTLDGRPIAEHPLIAGVLTNSYLIRQSKHEGSGRDEPRRGHPVLVASKDLRLLDPSLEKVIIVDDNPTRLFQLRNTRLFKKLRAQALCQGPPEVARAHRQAMDQVTAEIEQAAAYALEAKVPFARAFLPYTILGRVAVDWLRLANQWSQSQAIDFVRAHPEVVSERF